MCGIAGYNIASGVVDVTSINRMIDTFPYRGPDGEGVKIFLGQNTALGHRRLSIIDTSDLGAQPMANHDGRYWIVFNGEIYNYREIRHALEAEGFCFRSHSDTEVLINAYTHWGDGCLERLNGMFAFAIWDQQDKILFAARDRLGEKPFYYQHNTKGFIFASEIKAILAVDFSPPEADPSLIDAYMTFGYVPGENTLFKGIKRLLPGHYLVLRDNQLSIHRYWDFQFTSRIDSDLGADEARLDELLSDSINMRLRSDVPLGVFLSGGLDSSAVVAMLSPGASKGLKTFSVAYDFGPEFNETPYAREVATQYQTDHHEIIITPKDFIDFIPNYVLHMDEPVTEAAAISLYYVSRLAREHVVVALSGEGADEIFAGYDFYRYNLRMEQARSMLGGNLLRGLAEVGKMAVRSRKLRKYLDMISQPLETRYRGISSYEKTIKDALYRPEFRAVAKNGNSEVNTFIEALFTKSKDWDPLSRMLYFDTKTWLVDDLLIKADRMSMATSIELRVPFLDHRLVDYASTVPSRFKLHKTCGKFLLRKIMEDRLPTSVLQRKKMGFPTPLEFMFRGPLLPYAQELLLSSSAKIANYFSQSRIEATLNDHKSGRVDNHREIWQLIVLEEWHRQFAV